MAVIQCRHFNGYKPCGYSAKCVDSCLHKDIPENYILIIHLGAIGAVVRATSILSGIKKKYPSSHITWVTDAPSNQLLDGHPMIDRVLTSQVSDVLCLSALEFDVAFVIDKSLKAAGLLNLTKSKLVFGFKAESKSGSIIPANKEAQELWEIGLSDEKKFFLNQKSEVQLIYEALALGSWNRAEYNLPMTQSELDESVRRRSQWSDNGAKLILGVNTGCSATIEAKKLTIELQRKIIQELSKDPAYSIVLLGGPEDTDRNEKISSGLNVIQSPTNKGLRDGLISVDACDIVLTGDSLGMHLAIARKKWVVAWFGPTCAHEIELYNRGVRVLTKASCSPCWKRTCQKNPMCYDQVSIQEILEAVNKGREFWQLRNVTLSSKQPFSEIFY